MTGCQQPALPCHLGGVQAQASAEVFVSERELWVPKYDSGKGETARDAKKKVKGSSKGRINTGASKKMKERLREELLLQ